MASPVMGRSPRLSPTINADNLRHGRTTSAKISRNVYVTIAMCMIWGFGESIWTGTVLAAWLFDLAGGNKPEANSHANTVSNFLFFIYLFII